MSEQLRVSNLLEQVLKPYDMIFKELGRRRWGEKKQQLTIRFSAKKRNSNERK